MIDQIISHYRIVEKLGGAGMGVVYKAEDVSLHRFVALKFLPDDVAKDPNVLARFQREVFDSNAHERPAYAVVSVQGREMLTVGCRTPREPRRYSNPKKAPSRRSLTGPV